MAVPLQGPVHETLVLDTVSVNTLGCVITALYVAVQPFESVIVQVYVAGQRLVTAEVVFTGAVVHE